MMSSLSDDALVILRALHGDDMSSINKQTSAEMGMRMPKMLKI